MESVTDDIRVMDEWYQHGGMERVVVILDMMENILGYGDDVHPAIWNDKCRELLHTAVDSMAELYQEMGAWEKPE